MSSPTAEPGTRSGRPRWAIPLAAVLLTTLAGGTVLWTVRGHQTSQPAVPMAIVNSDQPVTQGSGKDAKTIAAGRQLAAGLNSPTPDQETPLSWQLVDAHDAASGLLRGAYYGVLTIPKDFSAAVTSTSGKHPKQATLTLTANQAASPAVAALAQLSVNQAAQTLGAQVTTNFVDTTLQNFTKINKNLTNTANSADSLAGSGHQLATSALSLADSSDQLAEGAASLAAGTRSLQGGTGSLVTGAQDTARGAAQVATGTQRLSSATRQLSSGASSLATGAEAAARGTSGLSRGATGVAAGAAALSAALDRQEAQLARLETLSRVHAERARTAGSSAQQVARECRAEGGSVRLCESLRRLRDRVVAESLGARGIKAASTVAERRASVSARGAGAVQRGASEVSKGANALVPAVTEVASGAASLSNGADQLSRSAVTLASGAARVAGGSRSVADGAEQTNSGAVQLTGAADQLAGGSSQLSSGAHQLADGSDQLAGGIDQLASGLQSGAKQVPSYTSDQRKQLDTVVTTPVEVNSKADNPSKLAAGIIPATLALALWLGTLMMLLTRPPVPVGPSWAQASPARRVLFGFLPVALVGLLQAGLLLGLVLLAKVPVASPTGLALFTALGVVAFAATNQALAGLFGSVGRLVSLTFVLVEAAALGGVVPVETAPAVIQLLNGVLPIPQFVNGALQLLLGGHGSLANACLVLLIWTVLALGTSVVITGRGSRRIGSPATGSPATGFVRPGSEPAAGLSILTRLGDDRPDLADGR